MHDPLFDMRIYSLDGLAAGWELGTNQPETYLHENCC